MSINMVILTARLGADLRLRSVRRNRSWRSYKIVKKAITALKLEQANPAKLHKLDELAAEHQRVVQRYLNWLIAHDIRQPDKYAAVP